VTFPWVGAHHPAWSLAVNKDNAGDTATS
jgi:hypothetical protein